jgi:hypothetical protein
MLMAFLCLQKCGNSPSKKPLVTPLIIILNFSKKMDKVYDDLKD